MSGGTSQGGGGFISVKADPDPGFTMEFDRLTGQEELGRPFLYNVSVSSTTLKADLTSLLGSSMTVSITKADKKSKRYFNGLVTRACFDGLVSGTYRYRFELRPFIWLLSQVQDCKIFQNMAPFDIIKKVLSDNGFSSFSDKRQASAGSTTLEYCVQYNETSLDFVTRLMEVYGLYYYFTHKDGEHTLVFADDPNSHSSIGDALPYAYKQTEYRSTDPHIWGWVSDQNLQAGTATFRDYNFTTPSADLTAKSQNPGSHSKHNTLEVYEYPGPYGTSGDGTKIANVRAQRFAVDRQAYQAISNSRELYVGCKFKMSQFAETAQNQEYMVTSAAYTVDAAESTQTTQGELADTFRCELRAIVGTTHFRLDCDTRWPVMRGPQTALVVGESGEEITTDKYGRIKVQFYWDRLGQKNQDSSCWIRVAQTWAGAQWGGMFIPRQGQEVIVEFLDGNPDRPIVTGCVYNATNMAPYGLPDNKTRSTVKTNSTTGGGGFNELRFEDKKGSEEVFFQAQKDYNKVVLNNETVKITQDTTTTVDKGNRSITLNQGDNSFTVSQGKNTVTVNKDFSTTVQTGNHSLTVSQGNNSETISAGNYTINVNAGSYTLKTGQAITIQSGQSITLKVALSSIVIDSTGVTVKGPKLALTANAELEADGGGMMTLKAGMININ